MPNIGYLGASAGLRKGFGATDWALLATLPKPLRVLAIR